MSTKPLRVLVVDDEPDMCWALEHMLASVGYAVTTTTRGREALELLAIDRYAVALIDAKLPDMDGLDLALTTSRESPHTAVILISGFYNPEDRAITEGLRAKCMVGFVAKPFDVSEIRQAVHLGIVRKEVEYATTDTAGR